MANNIQIKKIHEDFEKEIKKKSFEKLSVRGFNLIEKEKYLGDLTSLVSCSENIMEDLIKVYSDSDSVIEINSDSCLDIYGVGILYIIVKKSCSLELNFLDKKEIFSAPFVKILVEENIDLNLIEYSNSSNLYKNLFVVLKNNSNLISSQFIYNSSFNSSLVKLSNSCIYNLKSSYKISNNNSFIKNESFHIGENSKSNLDVKGIILNSARVINDGKIKISRNAINSVGHQNLKNLILDKSSFVSSDPILKVDNSKVECSHASSISKIDDEILFYIASKGISYDYSLKLIIDGFLYEVLENISSLKLKEKYISFLNLD